MKKIVSKRNYDNYQKAYHIRRNACVEKMLLLVGKKNCHDSRSKIREVIGCFDNSDDKKIEIIQIKRIDIIREEAALQLRNKYVKNQNRESASFDKFLKKIASFRSSLKKSSDLMDDKIIKKFLINKAYDDEEVPAKVVIDYYSETYNRIGRLLIEMEMFLSSNETKGRPSLDPLYRYVYELAALYKNLSQKNLSVYRHKENGEYKPVSLGHQFVYSAINLLNEQSLENGYKEIYTDKNIYNACENAQKLLKTSPLKPR